MTTYGGLTAHELRRMAQDSDLPDGIRIVLKMDAPPIASRLLADHTGASLAWVNYFGNDDNLAGRRTRYIVAAVNALGPLLDEADALRRRIYALEALCAERLAEDHRRAAAPAAAKPVPCDLCGEATATLTIRRGDGITEQACEPCYLRCYERNELLRVSWEVVSRAD